jgi:hypothetical protein
LDSVLNTWKPVLQSLYPVLLFSGPLLLFLDHVLLFLDFVLFCSDSVLQYSVPDPLVLDPELLSWIHVPLLSDPVYLSMDTLNPGVLCLDPVILSSV